ncbi:MAG: Lrp/AsnC ligand binding domain-containing protein [Candidatus Hadarchaeum sp.]|uniref:Lrp/AsnC ligand binding domain-containing protein n=1 Tax=Candidatus Hadarchaeum sp. TaxID=2883567 RepID=UPI003179B4EF
MPVAFVLVETKLGRIDDVLNRLLNVDEVAEAYTVAGPYAIVAKVETDSFEKLVKVIPEKIHTIEGIVKTLTLVAFGTGKEFRTDACDPAIELGKRGDLEALYALCRSCRQLKYCGHGARVITYGI